MTKFITILIGCCLALAASVQAEQEKENPKNKKSKPVQKQPVVQKQPTRRMIVPTQPNNQIHNNANSNMSKHQHNDALIRNPEPFNDPKLHADQTNKLPVVRTNTLPAVQSNNAPYLKPNKFTVKPNQPVIDPKPMVPSNKFQVNKNVKNFQPKHQNFHAQVNSSVASVHFNQNFHIKNAQNWKGNHYTVFKNYRPQWHDKGWWHSHHNHVVLIGGGWYFWNAGYWYPAWGYDNSAAYYPYDGPIYVGDSPRPFDQIVADVQSSLQEQGYYHGEVDGLVGPLTQEALAAYQSATGLEQTAAIDQPTLESLGIS